MALLLDHGLRVGELALITVANVDLKSRHVDRVLSPKG